MLTTFGSNNLSSPFAANKISQVIDSVKVYLSKISNVKASIMKTSLTRVLINKIDSIKLYFK